MKKRLSASITEVSIENLEPPPQPARSLVSSILYLLGDISKLGDADADEYCRSHPIVAVKAGRKKLIVVGQFRSFELALRLNRVSAARYPTAVVCVSSCPTDDAARYALKNLMMEGLIDTLAPEFAAPGLGQVWSLLDEKTRAGLLPSVSTQADFTGVIGYDSRTSFDPRRLNRVPRLKDRKGLKPSSPDAPLASPENDQ